MKANKVIRDELKTSDVRQWELAEELGFSPAWLNVRLRRELPGDEVLKMLKLIEQISVRKRSDENDND